MKLSKDVSLAFSRKHEYQLPLALVHLLRNRSVKWNREKVHFAANIVAWYRRQVLTNEIRIYLCCAPLGCRIVEWTIIVHANYSSSIN